MFALFPHPLHHEMAALAERQSTVPDVSTGLEIQRVIFHFLFLSQFQLEPLTCLQRK